MFEDIYASQALEHHLLHWDSLGDMDDSHSYLARYRKGSIMRKVGIFLSTILLLLPIVTEVLGQSVLLESNQDNDISTNSSYFTGKVVGVIDGDTIEVMHYGKAERIRLNGIDCPENHQAFGQKAKQFTSDLVFGKTVTVKCFNQDRYGRTLGEIILSDGKSLNKALISNGFAWWYWIYSQDETLGYLEVGARNSKIGLWSDLDAIPPWLFRRGYEATEEHTSTRPVKLFVPTNSNQPMEPESQLNNAITVYITRTGTKYHKGICRYLAKSKISISLIDALSRGYGPCSVCNPPTR